MLQDWNIIKFGGIDKYQKDYTELKEVAKKLGIYDPSSPSNIDAGKLNGFMLRELMALDNWSLIADTVIPQILKYGPPILKKDTSLLDVLIDTVTSDE